MMRTLRRMTQPSQRPLQRSTHLSMHRLTSGMLLLLPRRSLSVIPGALSDIHDVDLQYHGLWRSDDVLRSFPDLQAGLERELVNQHTLMEANNSFPVQTEATTPWQQLASEPGHILDPLTLSDLTSAG